MLALFAARMETPTARLILAVCIIAVGTAIASYGEVNLNALGIVFMFASESFEAIRLVMTQMLLVGLKMHPGAGTRMCYGTASCLPCGCHAVMLCV